MMFRFLYCVLFISSIKTCPLKTVDIQSGCYCGIEIDGSNYINCQPYSIEKIPEFTRSYIHDKLNLSNNYIEYLTNTSFHQLKVQRIYLEKNPIKFIDKEAFNTNILHYLEELYIDSIGNGSLEFLCYGTWKKLRILKLSRFNFNQYQHCFDRLNRLEKLIIQHSQIDIIPYHIYQLPFLYELSLVNNDIEYFNFDDQYLSYSSSIRILNLTLNQLQTVPNDLNIRLPHLITLDLSNNLIESLPSINEITKLHINLSFNLINYFEVNHNLHFIDLSFNPICTMEQTTDVSNIVMNHLIYLHCDCRLAFFLKKNLIDLSEYVGDSQPFGNQTMCASPQMFKGQYLKDLTYEQLITTCSSELPTNCKEVTNFEEIQQYVRNLIETIETNVIETEEKVDTSTQIIGTTEKLDEEKNSISSFKLTSFNAYYENNDLLIFWNFDASLLSNYFLKTKFQIIIEQEFPSKIEIIRETNYISPYLKQYIISNLSPNKIYHVCLIITRLSYGTDKYCRETKTTTNSTLIQTLVINRSTVLGFLIGTLLTICFLVVLAFICHLYYQRKHCNPIFRQQQKQKSFMYIDRDDNDGTYSYSLVSPPSLRYHNLRKNRYRTYLKPASSWYYHNSRQLSRIRASPCCFLPYNDRTFSSSLTTNRITSLSSDYSNGIDKEPVTSTSLMSNTSLDERSQVVRSSTKHVYEEVDNHKLFR
ncbi:unnamed protein product [Rotaria magnacalcarata]|uniref:Uncharacterized protein n=2 Tax=Rotaria magnacalcarata TaxID=392030 RepID=A0A819S5Z0_9BILA|nr:unnamed protein product [Rotaria magnacalcarata]